jgi:hypothetical protein
VQPNSKSIGCDTCNPGFFAEFKTLPCQACPRGKYQSQTQQTHCVNCVTGKYSMYLTLTRTETEGRTKMRAHTHTGAPGSREDTQMKKTKCGGKKDKKKRENARAHGRAGLA